MTPADWFIIVGIAVIAIADVWLIVCSTPTISRRFRLYGRKVSSFPFAWGVLGGHFWGPDMEPAFGSWVASIGALLLSTVWMGVMHWAFWRKSLPPAWSAVVYLGLGVAAGIFFWPQ